jgi:pyruvate-formate lyase
METLNEINAAQALSRARCKGANPFARELVFTDVYRRNLSSDRVTRELACLHAMFPAALEPMREHDALVGRVSYPLVGFSPEPGGLGYYCREAEIRQVIEQSSLSANERAEAESMLEFWRGRTTTERVRAACPPEVNEVLFSDDWTQESGMAFPLYRMAGTVLDYRKLLDCGLDNLRRQLREELSDPHVDAEGRVFLSGVCRALELVSEAANWYASQAETLAESASDKTRRQELHDTATLLRRVACQAPQTLHEAIQLQWLYVLLSGTWNYGRMDTYLGPFLAEDLTIGRLDQSTALALLEAFWRLMTDYSNQYNNRVVIGGAGRVNETQADAFALLALEATRRVLTNQPQLTLRFHQGQNPALYERAMDILATGRTFPLLYNDDINVPAVMRAFQVTREEAEQYVLFGCGEYILEHRSIGSPNGLINLAKCLEVTLHGGVDPVSGRGGGLPGDPSSFNSFEDLWDAYRRETERQVAALALQERIEYSVVASEAPFLLLSALYDDCLSRRRPIFDGGVHYLGGTLETYGNINTADSLTAIDQLVYRQRRYSLSQVVAACDNNFSGHDQLRRDLLAAPKYGNDHAIADGMARRVHEHICRVTREQANKVGLHSYLVVIINNWANAIFGRTTGALPDGRLAGDVLANANNPSPGMDLNGATAFLNSLVKLDPDMHAGAVQNMKFSRNLFVRQRPIVDALMRVYFQQGGAQAMINVLDRRDLEAAMKEPEKWGHLMVRVGGFSARFIDLPKEAQLDVLRRTLY